MKDTRNFLMATKPYDPRIHDVRGWYVCSYVLGTIAFWDGGLSRGQLVSTIPWAKSATKISTGYATGMWSIGLAPLKVSDAWLNQLPCIPLIGTLHKVFGELFFAVTACPAMPEILKDGPVKRSTGTKVFSWAHNTRWMDIRKQYKVPDFQCISDNSKFEDELWYLDYNLATHESDTFLLKHKKLPDNDIARALSIELEKNPDGLVLRSPSNVWSSTSENEYVRLLP